MGRQYSRPLVVALDEPDSAAGLERIDLANAGSGGQEKVSATVLLLRHAAPPHTAKEPDVSASY